MLQRLCEILMTCRRWPSSSKINGSLNDKKLPDCNVLQLTTIMLAWMPISRYKDVNIELTRVIPNTGHPRPCRYDKYFCSWLKLVKLGLIFGYFHSLKWFTEWAETNKDWLHIEFLPPYSPDFNPIERLWRWMKTEHTHNRCWSSKLQLKNIAKGCDRNA